MKKRIGLALLAVVTLLAACAPQGSAVQGETRSSGGTERAAGPKRINVAVRTDGAAVWTTGAESIIELFHAGLVNFDPPGDPTAQLAETLPTIENGLWKLFPDGRMETTLTIREGARWHDGVPVTTADAVFGVAHGREFPQGNFGASAFANIEQIDARDERTIIVTWKSPYVQANWLFSNLFAPPLPRHLLEESFLADPAGFVNHRYWTTDFVGNGPFVVRDFMPGLHLQLRAFEDYVLGRPQIDEIEVRYIPDANTLMANLLAGDIHLTLGAGLSVEQALRVREGWSEGEVIYSPYYATQAVGAPQFINPEPAILANVQLRRALAHAVDREELVQSIQAGIGAPSSSLPAPTGPEFEAVKNSIVDYPYDPRRASQLLESLGYTRGADGMVRDASGRELSMPVWTSAGDDVYERTTLAVADYWKRLGVATEPRIVPPTRDASIMASRPAFYITRLRTELDTRFLSAQIPTAENGFRGSNDARYGNPELDALVNRYFVTVPRAERLNTLAEIVRHQTENVVVIHLFHNVVPQMKNQRLKNVVPRTVRARVLDPQRWELS
jgi:peptide/nickel transport system substrate-binding protein